MIQLFSIRAVLSAVVALALPLAAYAQAAPAAGASMALPPPQPASLGAATTASGDRSYILGVGDVLEVGVLGRSDFNGRARVGSDGNILLPYVGVMPAIGRSPGQLAEEIRAALEKGGFFSNPSVRVDIIGMISQFVTVLGFVGAPGLVPLDRPYHLSEIVARAGGRAGSGADYVVLTRGSGKSQQFKLSELATGSGEKDPLVVAGDKIYVPAADNDVFYITGQVKSPGAFPAGQEMTLRTALARAGGLSDMGSEKKIKINRKGVQLKKIKLDETKVEAGDIISVGERLF